MKFEFETHANGKWQMANGPIRRSRREFLKSWEWQFDCRKIFGQGIFFFLPFCRWVGSRHPEGSSVPFRFVLFSICPLSLSLSPRLQFSFPFDVQWNWISFLFDLHTDVYVDHTHLIGFEWQIDSHATCESIAIYGKGGKLILWRAEDLPRSVISSDRARLALLSCSFRFSLLINFASVSATIPRHRWQGAKSEYIYFLTFIRSYL